MARAELLMPFILRWEGGFVNDPVDRGGATNKGVTMKTYTAYCRKKGYSDPTVEDLQKIPDKHWLDIFRSEYWNPCRADGILNQSVANAIVDWAWCSGTGRVIRKVQQILSVKADGIAGPVTIDAVNREQAELLFLRIQDARLCFVENIVRKDPKQKKFLKGWKNRINSLKF